MPKRRKTRVLFLCTGNAARSQMAEALARLDHGDVLDPVSAGSRPCGFVHPLATRAILEIGGDMSSAYSTGTEQFLDEQFDIVVTVCDSAAADCPTWPNAKRIEHWSIEDPSYGPDDPNTRYDRFLERRDEIRRRIDGLVKSLSQQPLAVTGS